MNNMQIITSREPTLGIHNTKIILIYVAIYKSKSNKDKKKSKGCSTLELFIEFHEHLK